MKDLTPSEALEAVSALAEPARRALYEYVAAAPDAVGRDQAAEAVGVSRQAAAYHLDRLADDGLLSVEYRRLTGR
ncbi:MAG TPA: helix-turn-helix domain-containing protein, partial [Acidimicrobiia bacterium]|nr:helix-turn-helix domain-containing protein [Acidimicrobiia bacterium]